MKRAVIIYGPPGSGKGTQAELLARRFNFVHFDTGRYLENLLYSPDWQNDPVLKKEREIFDKGELNTPSWVLSVVRDATKRISDAGMSIVYSGSPRTLFEAFGNDEKEGLLTLLKRVYGKENIDVIFLQVKEDTSIKRNSARVICSICGLPILDEANLKKCSFCAGPARKRSLDKPEVIKIRLKEYRERTYPVVERMEKEGYRVHKIDGEPPPYEVFNKVVSVLGLKTKNDKA